MRYHFRPVPICVVLTLLYYIAVDLSLGADKDANEPRVLKSVIDADLAGENLLKPDAWSGWKEGFERDGDLFVCDNGDNTKVQRGAGQSVELNQTVPEPILAAAWSRAEAVGSSSDSNYSVYVDLQYNDGSSLWGQVAPFSTGTHDWQRRQVVIVPERPVRRLSMYVLLRGHSGRAWFRDMELRVIRAPAGGLMFDGVPVMNEASQTEAGFQIRDVVADSDIVRIDRSALGVSLDYKTTKQDDVTFYDVTLTDTTGRDRAITLYYAVPISPENLSWLADPRRTMKVEPRREYVDATRFRAGAGAGLSRYPLGAVADISGDLSAKGTALAIDMSRPAFYRIGYNSSSGELFLAYDIGLTQEKPTASLRFCRYGFESCWGFRAALARLYEIFTEQFSCRTPEQGLWMPFAPISRVPQWEDFGFKFKEGNSETNWDDQHGITTFRYTEPMTWWMRMSTDLPRTNEAAIAEARRLAESGDPRAQSLLTSGYHDEAGRFVARLRDTPWCNGAVWSINSMPGIEGEITDFKLKWNDKLHRSLYDPNRNGQLDGEYIDSSEGYVTDELDFRRNHFHAADTPLTFSRDTLRPAIFRGLIVFEYVRAIAQDIHAMDKLMMANGAPTRLCWLVPMLDVAGTETNWHRSGRWSPLSDAELLYRRALCRHKPYCFLMNTDFEQFSQELVERYMKRSLAYGMFPGFFSHNASEGHYFSRPELYNRDRPLFKRYVPLCKKLAEAGWQPITLARSSDDRVYVERYGDRYLTVFNDSPEKRTSTITLAGLHALEGIELLSGRPIKFENGRTELTLDAEDVAVIELRLR